MQRDAAEYLTPGGKNDVAVWNDLLVTQFGYSQPIATAVLDKMSGAVLIAARQRQARAQLLAGIVEQLLVESKRARDTEAAAMNMQLVTWRDGRAANEAFVSGTASALNTWRQP